MMNIKNETIMNEENKNIHEFDVKLICDYFSHIKRQGPGSTASTKKALEFIDLFNENTEVVDLGSGSGAQSLVLAQETQAKITAIDLFPKFINLLNQQAKKHGLDKRLKGIVGSMEELPFKENEIDVIWSEGAIYNIGFQRGIIEWRKFLKSGGYLAVTEVCWLTKTQPEEIYRFWKEAYPEIDSISNKISQIQAAGYIPTACFVLPENCWTEEFYAPQKAAATVFLKKHPNNQAAIDLVKNEEREAALYAKYKEYYSYVFFIAKKTK
jgi:ubiquinone/menaquinone biosynthesis C-methylase UbiE